MRLPQEIISSLEIIKVHGRANFGPRTPRSVVNEALLKVACRYANGSTATMILIDHKLIVCGKHTGSELLTEKGRKYLWSVFGEGIP